MANAKPSGPGRKVPPSREAPQAYAGKTIVRNDRGQPVIVEKFPDGKVTRTIVFEEDVAGLIEE